MPTLDPTMTRTKAPRRKTVIAAWTVLAVVCVAALAASLAFHVARAAVRDRLVEAGAARGLTVSVGDVHMPLSGPIQLSDVRVEGPSGSELSARIDKVTTDVSVWDALDGVRRPAKVTVRGLRARLAVVDGAIVGLTPPAPAGSASAASPLDVQLVDAAINASVKATLPHVGPVVLDPVQITDVTGTISRDANRRFAISVNAMVDADSGDEARVASGELKLTRNSASARFDPPLRVGAAAAGERIDVRVTTVARDSQGDIALGGLSVRARSLQASADTIALAGALRPDGLTLLVPKQVTLTGVSAERGRDSLVGARIEVELADDGTGVTVPVRVSGQDVGVRARGGALEARLKTLNAELASPTEALAALAADAPWEALKDVRATGPTLRLTADPQALPSWLDALRPALSPSAPAALSARAEAPDANPAPAGRPRALLRAIERYLGSHPVALQDGHAELIGPDGSTLITLADAGLTTEPHPSGGLAVHARGAVHRDGAERARVDVRSVIHKGVVAHASGTLSGSDIAHHISRLSDHIAIRPAARVNLRFDYERPSTDGRHRVTGAIGLHDFTFKWWRLSDAIITDLNARASFDLSVEASPSGPLDIRLKVAEVIVDEARLAGSLDLTWTPGEMPRRFDARVTMPRQDCGAVARSIPRALLPRLTDLELVGEMAFDARLALDFADPRGLELSVNGDLAACNVRSLGPGIHPKRLTRRFTHRPREPKRGTLSHIRLGPATRSFIKSEDLPELVKTMAWVTEDRRYFRHKGVRWDLIERALKLDLEKGYFVYGGSTITQQLVKNLYLDRGKTLGRKLEEAIIAWQMERVLSKDEILTLYVNLIEYGPDIYGIKQAARYYFDKPVEALDALEIAFIMGLKPYPHRGHAQWVRGELPPWWIRRVRKVLTMTVARSDLIDRDDIAILEPLQPAFRAPTASDLARAARVAEAQGRGK